MVQQRVAEIAVGFFMLLGVLALVVLAVKVSGLSEFLHSDGYVLRARFENVGDLKVRAPITIAGVPIGQVTRIELDPKAYLSVVSMAIDRTVVLPKDSSASIFTQGLLGSNYIEITPGFADSEPLKTGDTLRDTHSAVILENLIGQLIFNGKDKKTDDHATESTGGKP